MDTSGSWKRLSAVLSVCPLVQNGDQDVEQSIPRSCACVVPSIDVLVCTCVCSCAVQCEWAIANTIFACTQVFKSAEGVGVWVCGCLHQEP